MAVTEEQARLRPHPQPRYGLSSMRRVARRELYKRAAPVDGWSATAKHQEMGSSPQGRCPRRPKQRRHYHGRSLPAVLTFRGGTARLAKRVRRRWAPGVACGSTKPSVNRGRFAGL